MLQMISYVVQNESEGFVLVSVSYVVLFKLVLVSISLTSLSFIQKHRKLIDARRRPTELARFTSIVLNHSQLIILFLPLSVIGITFTFLTFHPIRIQKEKPKQENKKHCDNFSHLKIYNKLTFVFESNLAFD